MVLEAAAATAHSASLPLLALNLIASAIWIGGLVVIAIVARAARKTLAPAQRVEFFKVLGRGYGAVGSMALVIALLTAILMLRRHPWSSTEAAAAVTAAALLAATTAGMLQATAISRLRRTVLDGDGVTTQVRSLRRGARIATSLRAAIGMLTLALTVLAAALART